MWLITRFTLMAKRILKPLSESSAIVVNKSEDFILLHSTLLKKIQGKKIITKNKSQ
jgi:hypothetical protein